MMRNNSLDDFFFSLKVSGCRMSKKGGLTDLSANKSPPASSCF
jgi:hypothetical protein